MVDIRDILSSTSEVRLANDVHDPTSQSSQQGRYTYSELLARKDRYKAEAHANLKIAEALEQQNIELRRRLEESFRQQHAERVSRHSMGATDLEQENLLLRSQVLDVEEFLRACEVKDLSQARKEWFKDKDNLERTCEQLSKLQDEVLTCVERFDPNFDTHLFQSFMRLNNTIGKLSKAKELEKMVLQGNPLTDWDDHALWKDSFNPSIRAGRGPSNMEKRLLLRQAIWKFIGERLFDRAAPLASFGGATGEIASHLCFDKLFPDHEVNENAGKWRSITVRQLNSHVSKYGEGDKNDLLGKLSADFAAYTQDKLAMGTIRQEQLDSMLTKGDLNKKLEEVFKRAIEFSRLIMQERAAFTIESPCLSEIKFTRVEDDESTTAQGVVIGVNDGHDLEADIAGSIKLVGSPILRKHGDGGGQNLNQNMVVVRAFVLIDP